MYKNKFNILEMTTKEKIKLGKRWYDFTKENNPELLGECIIEYVESLRNNLKCNK